MTLLLVVALNLIDTSLLFLGLALLTSGAVLQQMAGGFRPQPVLGFLAIVLGTLAFKVASIVAFG